MRIGWSETPRESISTRHQHSRNTFSTHPCASHLMLVAQKHIAAHQPLTCACVLLPIPLEVLHVARHLLWYTLVRPARLGDWAGMELNAQVLLLSAVLLLLAACPRRGRLWALWRR